MDITVWLQDHWPELATALGVGSGGGFLGKKMTDKSRDRKVNDLSEKVMRNEKEIARIDSEQKTNTLFDKQFRDQTKEEREDIKRSLKELREHQGKILDYLLNKKT